MRIYNCLDTFFNEFYVQPGKASGNASEATDEDSNESAKEEYGEKSDKEVDTLPCISVDGGHRQVERQEEGEHDKGGNETRRSFEPKISSYLPFLFQGLPVSHGGVNEWHSDRGDHAGDNLNFLCREYSSTSFK